MSKHTPGPWHVGDTGLVVYGSDGYAVANATTYHGRISREISNANARAIAALPDLIAALSELAAVICFDDDDDLAGDLAERLGIEDKASLVSLLGRSRAAISKAEGR